MERLKSTGLLYVLLITLGPFIHCREAYMSPYVPPSTGYLVVESYIGGNVPVTCKLSRVARLSADSTMLPAPGAQVQVEGNDNSIYPLTDQGKGMYGSSGVLSLNPSAQYRLRITTATGGKYLSDYVPYKITPAIDSINWESDPDGVRIFANAHDDAAATRYYMWSYDETWEYRSGEESMVYYDETDHQIHQRDSSQQIYRCWRNYSSTSILTFSTDKLSGDVVYEYPLRYIPINSEPISVLYSILVRQYAVTRDGYEFLSLMRQNTESKGTIFDAQPSELSGNIHSLSNPGETVIGYISAGSVIQQRIFIAGYQLPYWRYVFSCLDMDSLVPPAKFAKTFTDGLYIPVMANPRDPSPTPGYFANLEGCIDCRLQGGSTFKPSFWPN
ncbi:MAG: DUF4249 domain-containing protein [Bacteroidota bacterium]|nr:DUF4249 domain-containing protein [Bacteroidota bacterium]MDP4246130.1 DUF4249 domain-containing protein [Bacteroidota bacterium]MDP4252445.1 DUF4249 domain-containing protein [Bacteroidota bacterium]MDP4256629.1 DUF4249 domain-containing protein [Bacteroidota bacterium]